MYTPNNQAIFLNAYAGAIAGMAASNRVPQSYTPYSQIATIAGVFAQAVDGLWGANPSTSLQAEAMQSTCEAVWQNRAPQLGGNIGNISNYYDLAAAIILEVNAAEDYFTANGINPDLPSNGIPPVSGISGATIVERPGGTRIAARLKQSEIDPSIAVTSWAKTAPNGNNALYRRGDSIAGITATAAYLVAGGNPTIASVADSYANGAADSGGGVWSSVAPFTAWSRTASVVGSGVDANPDPQWTATLTATSDITVQAAFSASFASDIYFGASASASIVGTNVYNAGLQAGFSDVLNAFGKPGKQVRQAGGTSGYSPYAITIAGSQYGYVLWPNQAQYTSGTIGFFNNDTGFAVPMSQLANTTILRNGVTRTYQVWRTGGIQGTSFNLEVT